MGPDGDLGDGLAQRGDRAVDVGGGGPAASEKRSTARRLIDADRRQDVVRAARARRAGRTRRRIDPARLQRVQNRLGGQARERQRADVGHARRADHRRPWLGESVAAGVDAQHLALQPIPLAAHRSAT